MVEPGACLGLGGLSAKAVSSQCFMIVSVKRQAIMNDNDGLDEIVNNLFGDDQTEPSASKENSKTETEDEAGDLLSKEEIQEQFDGEYAASPTGKTQHLVYTDDSQTLCKKDLHKKEWPQSSEPGPFKPVCSDCKSALAGPSEPTSDAEVGSRNEARNWFAKRVDVRSAEEADHHPLTKAELQAVVNYIQSLESDNE